MEMDGWHPHITLRQINSKKNGTLFYPMGKTGKDTSDFDNSVVSMFRYIEDNREKMVSAKDVIK